MSSTMTAAYSTSSISEKANSGNSDEQFIFTPENFRRPQLPSHLNVIDVPMRHVTMENHEELLRGYGHLVKHPNDFRVEDRTFEIVKWPVQGWRQLDPLTGDEAGTTEGPFEVEWKGDFYCGKNLAINTVNNTYLDGLGTRDPEQASELQESSSEPNEHGDDSDTLFLWMSDYHPDGGQLFFPSLDASGTQFATNGDSDSEQGPFFVCLGKSTYGDDIRPEHMCAFRIPAGFGLYIHPGTWHNGIYINRKRGKKTFFTRQGRIHARVSCSWAAEHGQLLRLKLVE